MLRLSEEYGKTFEVRGYFPNMQVCSEIGELYSFEEAIGAATAEWCEGQSSAEIYDAETGETYAEIESNGAIRLAARSSWYIEVE